MAVATDELMYSPVQSMLLKRVNNFWGTAVSLCLLMTDKRRQEIIQKTR